MESVGKAILRLPFDGVEVRHGCPLSIPGNIWAGWLNRFGRQLPALGNSDSHLPFTVGQAFTWFPGHTSLDLRQAIKARRVRPGGTTWKIADMWHSLRYISQYRVSKHPARQELYPQSSRSIDITKPR